MVNGDRFWRLRDDCHLRCETFGVLVYLPGGNCVDIAAPAVAVALGLMNGRRSETDIARELERRFELMSGEVDTFLESIIARYRGFMADPEQPTSAGPARERDLDAFYYDAPLWRPGISVTEHRFSAPIALTWIATRRCNFSCAYCYVDSSPSASTGRKGLPPERLRDLLDEAVDLGVASLMITGGEPLLVEGIYDVIRHAMGCEISVDLNSNGTVLANPAYAERLAESGQDDIVISIDSASPDLHARICGTTEQTHGQVLAGIRHCLKNGIDVKTNTLLCSATIPQLDELIDLLAEVGVRRMLFSHYVGSFHNRRDDLFPTLESYEAVLENLERARERYPDLSLDCPELERTIYCLRRGESPGINRCDSLKRGLIIFPDGRVSFCDTLQGRGDDDEFMIGDLKTRGIAEIWSDPRFPDLLSPGRSRFAGTVCADCDRFEDCMSAGHCYSRALIRFGTGYAPDPFCPVVYPGAGRMI